MQRSHWYVISIFWVAALLTVLLCGLVEWNESNRFLSTIWICCFYFVAINISYLIVVTALSLFVRHRGLPQNESCKPARLALLYVVKNEPITILASAIESLRRNNLPGVDLWLVSNSDEESCITAEIGFITNANRSFGGRCYHYRPAGNSTGRKHVAIQRWLADNQGYEYFLVCDADSVLDDGLVATLVKMAGHPENQDYAVFQSHLLLCGSRTWFAKLLEPGQNLVQRVFCEVNFQMLGTSPYYGHGALIRSSAFRCLPVPDHVLSHDLWDTAELHRRGWRIAFCPEVITEEMFPSNYLEFKRRSRRWIIGTLEAMPLVFQSKLCLGARFYLALASYVYLVQPVFVAWVLMGLLAHTDLGGPLLKTQSAFLGGVLAIDFEMSGFSLLTIGVMWLYKFRYCKSLRDVLSVTLDVVTGTAVLLNNLFYETWYILAYPWSSRKWTPMKKVNEGAPSFKRCLVEMLPSTCCGIVLLAAGVCVAPTWALYSSPILASFILGPITTYVTAQDATLRFVPGYEILRPKEGSRGN